MAVTYRVEQISQTFWSTVQSYNGFPQEIFMTQSSSEFLLIFLCLLFWTLTQKCTVYDTTYNLNAYESLKA